MQVQVPGFQNQISETTTPDLELTHAWKHFQTPASWAVVRPELGMKADLSSLSESVVLLSGPR